MTDKISGAIALTLMALFVASMMLLADQRQPFAFDMDQAVLWRKSLYNGGSSAVVAKLVPQKNAISLLGAGLEEHRLNARQEKGALQVSQCTFGNSDALSGYDPQTNRRSREDQSCNIQQRYTSEDGFAFWVLVGVCILIGLLGTLGICRWRGLWR